MKKMMLVAMATIATLYACSPKMNTGKNQTVNQLSTDNSGKTMLLGACTKSALEQAPFNEWYHKNYTDYKVNDSVTSTLKTMIAGKTFLIFLGTWCGDSKREVPRMLKILESSGVKKSQVKLIMVDDHDSAYKQSPAHEERGLNIHRVPTLLVYENKKEIGRMVESPVVTIEKDLFAILSGSGYKPKYRGVTYMNSLFSIDNIMQMENKIAEISKEVKPMLKNAGELNTYGYVLMYAKETDKALLVFKLNAMLYPENANVFDSLGEYYLNTGNKNAARENYRKVLEIDAKNENAKKMLEKIGG